MNVESITGALNVDSISIEPNSSKTEACTIMKLSKDESKDKYMFKSETVIKNDKYGIVVWLETNNIKKNNLRYQVYLLEKSSSSWIFKYGFITNKIVSNAPAAIESPDESKTINVTHSAVTNDYSESIVFNKTKYYSGIWEENSSGCGNSLFNAAFKFIKEKDYEATGFLADYKDNKLSKYSSNMNRTGELAKWFESFKDKKGKWNNLKDYCEAESLARNISKETENFLKTYCYKPAS